MYIYYSDDKIKRFLFPLQNYGREITNSTRKQISLIGYTDCSCFYGHYEAVYVTNAATQLFRRGNHCTQQLLLTKEWCTGNLSAAVLLTAAQMEPVVPATNSPATQQNGYF
jgi:hypothetical protein